MATDRRAAVQAPRRRIRDLSTFDRHPVTLADADEPILVSRARAGDAAAFKALVQRHEAAVARTVMRLLGDGDEADDVGQQTFLRLHASLAQFRGDASVSTYLQRIAMNLSLNALRARKRRNARFSRDATQAVVAADPAPLTDARLEAEETRTQIAAAIDRLPDSQRDVVMLRLLQDRSTRDAARQLGVPEGTVLSRLSRGLAQLRRDLHPSLGLRRADVKEGS